jgi:prepilin peptidase CpaA
MTILSYGAFLIFPLVMVYAGVSDLLSMTIPNRLSLLGIAAFIIAAPIAGLGLGDIGLHLAAGAVVLVAGFAMFAFGWIGGGDAKIAAVAALWLGLSHTLEFLLLSSVFGGMLSIFILLARRRFLPVIAVRQQWIMRLHDPSTGVPYGLALGAAALAVYPKTIWLGLVVS